MSKRVRNYVRVNVDRTLEGQPPYEHAMSLHNLQDTASDTWVSDKVNRQQVSDSLSVFSRERLDLRWKPLTLAGFVQTEFHFRRFGFGKLIGAFDGEATR